MKRMHYHCAISPYRSTFKQSFNVSALSPRDLGRICMCFYMASVSPEMSRLSPTFAARSDLASYNILKYTLDVKGLFIALVRLLHSETQLLTKLIEVYYQ